MPIAKGFQNLQISHVLLWKTSNLEENALWSCWMMPTNLPWNVCKSPGEVEDKQVLQDGQRLRSFYVMFVQHP